MKESAPAILARLLTDLGNTKSFPVRCGAALGLAGCVKGFGIACLKANDVMPRLEEMAQSKVSEARHGALLAFAALSETLGMLFEPFVARVLPLLLKSYGDSAENVREQAHSASKAIMGKMSSTGVAPTHLVLCRHRSPVVSVLTARAGIVYRVTQA